MHTDPPSRAEADRDEHLMDLASGRCRWGQPCTTCRRYGYPGGD